LVELKQIISLTLLTLIIGISGLTLINFFPSMIDDDVTVDRYDATFYLNGTLVENYSYDVKVSNKYSMLYRVWDAPLSMIELDRPSVQYLSRLNNSFSNLVFYLKDYQGITWVEDQRERAYLTELQDEIKALAYRNELGFYKPGMYEAGKYYIGYTFIIRPPIEYDDNFCHLNLKLADEHISYKKINIVVEDADRIIKIYAHPPTLSVSRQENRVIIQGSIEENKLLEIEMLLKKDVLDYLEGFPKKYDDVSTPTIQSNNLYLLQNYLAQGLLQITRILVISSPLIFILIYVIYGREKKFSIPKYLSFVPNNDIKPWVVNLIFKNDALDFDENGFYATLLDLHERKKINIMTKNKGLVIQILNQENLDNYEKRVMDFLQGISDNGIIDTNKTNKLAKKLSSSPAYESKLLQLKKDLSYVIKRPEIRVAKEYIVNGRMRPVPILLISIILLIISFALSFIISDFNTILKQAGITSILVIIQSTIAIAFPSTLFGKWKGKAYKEKLEWDSFKRLLSDLALIKKYAPGDLSMWGEWLVYGTSLGLGKNVAKVMKELKIPLDEVKFIPFMPLFVRPIMSSIPYSQTKGRSGVGGFSGGGFGAGGGFGGGGAGAR
jgi:uncharacterized membrane protein